MPLTPARWRRLTESPRYRRRLQLHARVRCSLASGSHATSLRLQRRLATTRGDGLARLWIVLASATIARVRRRSAAGADSERRVTGPMKPPAAALMPPATLVGPHRGGARRARPSPIAPTSSNRNCSPRTMRRYRRRDHGATCQPRAGRRTSSSAPATGAVSGER